jgi:ubiquinone/menaquinone biosynthesis C-methylase UbiE
MRQKQLVPLRERMVGLARGRVLEVGLGSGLNLPFYGREVEELVGIDPSRELLTRARKHTSWVHFPVKLMECGAERLPLEDGSVDSVVMTWTLCSIGDPGPALAEMRRVLRPGGALIFIEHGRAPEEGVRRWQERITPVWRKVAGGCHLDRPVDRLIEASGLRLIDLETGYMVKGPQTFTFHYRGQAIA